MTTLLTPDVVPIPSVDIAGEPVAPLGPVGPVGPVGPGPPTGTEGPEGILLQYLMYAVRLSDDIL